MFSVKCGNGAGWQDHWERSYIDSRNPNKKNRIHNSETA